MVTQNTTTAGAASAARHIQLTEPQANQQIVIDNIAGAALDMAFPSEAAQLEQSGQDLVFLFENGGRIVLSNFFGLFESNQLPAFTLEDGQSLPGDAFLAALREDLLPAAGPGAGAAAGSGGVGDYDDDAGNLIGGVDRLDPLGTGTFGVTSLATIEDEGIIDPANGTLLVSLTTGISTTIGEGGEYPDHEDAVPPGAYVGAFEDWQPNQHLGFTEAFAAAFGFTFTPDDNEVLNSITFIGPIAGTLLVGGVEVLPNGAGNFVIAAADIGNVTLLPLADSGTDIPLSGFASITDPDSGLTGTVPFAFTAVVDAVADQPLDLVAYGPFVSIPGGEEEAMEMLARFGRPGSHDAPNGDGLTAADPGGADEVNSAVHITLSATFGDYQDGSEQHYLIIEKKGDWTYEKVVFPDGTELDLSEFLEPGSEILMLGSDIAASGTQGGGLGGINPDGLYYVIPVGDESITDWPTYTDAQGQLHEQATKSVTLVMYPPDEPYQPGEGSEEPIPSLAFFGGDKHDGNNHDYQEHFVTGALAVDRDADGSLTTVNDASLVLGSVTVEVAPADGSFKVTGQHWGLEDPQAYSNDPPSFFDPLSLKDIDLNFKFTPDDDEVLDEIRIVVDPETPATILVDGELVEPTNGVYIISADDMHRVTLMPQQNSDVDVKLTVTAHFHDPDSGDAATKTVKHTVLIDAVADKPDVHVDVYQSEDTDTGKFEGSFQYGEQAMVKVTATFHDLDGSEEHTVKLFIPKGFELPEGYDIPGGGVLHETPFGNYISWEVPGSQADFLQDIPVVYTGSANSGSVKFVASATAEEVNLSGEELTRLNNWAEDSSSEWVQIKDKDPHAKDGKVTFDEDRLNVADPLHDGTDAMNPSAETATLSISGTLNYGFGYSDPAATGAFKWGMSPDKTTETDWDDYWTTWGKSVALKSGGQDVNWELSGDGRTLIGYVGDNPDAEGVKVISIELTGLTTGAYTVTLLGPIDHPDNDARTNPTTGSDSGDKDVIQIEIPYTITDEFGRTASGDLFVKVQDDAPVACPTASSFGLNTLPGAELEFRLDGNENDVAGLLSSTVVDLRVDGGTPFFSSSGLGVTYDGNHVADGPMSPDRENEVGYRDDKLGHEQEGVVFKLDGVANSFSLSTGAFYSGGEGEVGTVKFYLGDTLVSTQTLSAAAQAGGFSFTGLPLYDRVVVSGADNSGDASTDNSDFYITSVKFGMVSQIGASSGDLNIEYGADGDGLLAISYNAGDIWTWDGHKVNVVPDGTGLKGVIEGTDDVAFTMSIDATGKWVFTQNVPLDLPGYALSNLQFKYTAYDGDGDKVSGTFKVNVFEVERAPDIDMPAVAHVVYEKGLTSEADHSETVSGSFTIDMQGEGFAGSDAIKVGNKVFSSLDELESDDTLFIGVDGNVTTEGNAIGKLDVTTVSGPVDGHYTIEYEYTLLHNVDHNFPDGGVTGNIIPIEVKDASGDTANATLTIAIVDDVPKAYDNAASVTEDSGTGQEATGNLITDFLADRVGADADDAHISHVKFGTTTYEVGASGVEIDTPFGKLHVYQDGSYTYTLDNDAAQPLGPSSNESEQFTYTLTDGDGDTAQATLTVAINGVDEPRILTFGEVPEGQVYEADLAGGSGWPGDGLVSNGEFTITSSSGLTELKIGGENVNLSLADGSTQDITTDHGTLTITDIDHVGDVYTVKYTYTLTQPATNPDADHNGVNEDYRETLQIKATDSTGTATHDLVVNIADDHPKAVADTDTYSGGMTNNVVIVLDVSGSMGYDAGTPGPDTRLDLAKDAIEQLLDAYGSLGAVNVKLVWFSSSAEQETGWLTLSQAKDAVDDLRANGNTNYDSALTEVMSALSNGLPPADNSVVYFLSDGAPNRPSGSVGIDSTEQEVWEAFLKSSPIDMVYAFGMGSGLSKTELNPVGWERDTPSNDKVVDVITDMTQLSKYLLATVPTDGNLLDNDSAGADGWPAGAKLASVNYNNGDGNTGDDNYVIGVDGDNGTWNGHVLTLALTGGQGTLKIDFDSGSYVYTPGANPTGTAVVGYTIVDADGTTRSSTLTLTLSAGNIIANNNTESLGTVVVDDFASGYDVDGKADGWTLNSGAELHNGAVRMEVSQGFLSGDTASMTKGYSGVEADTTMAFKWTFNRANGRDTNDDRLRFVVTKDGTVIDNLIVNSAADNLNAGGVFFYTFAAAGNYTVEIVAEDTSWSSSNRDFTATVDDVTMHVLDGNVVTDHNVADVQDALHGHTALVSEVNGHAIGSGYTAIGGEHGDLYINSYGEYHYVPHEGRTGDDVFAYTLHSATGGDDTALLTIHAGSGSAAAHSEVMGSSASETLDGTDANDVIMGLAGNDILNGLGGHDILIGGTGNDYLHGGAGNDVLIGGQGSDHLYGENGADTMIWNAGDITNQAVDYVHGFEKGVDVLRFADVLIGSDPVVTTGQGSSVPGDSDDAVIRLSYNGQTQHVVVENYLQGISSQNVPDALTELENQILNHKIVTETSGS